MAPARYSPDHRTQLQRAFAVFQRMAPQPGTARDLACWMNVPVECGYFYVKALKALRCIERKGGSEGRPLYGVVEGASAPPALPRGRRPRLRSLGLLLEGALA